MNPTGLTRYNRAIFSQESPVRRGELLERIRTGTFVVPGIFLSTVEEFMPGEGAYEENGKVYSSRAGPVLVDIKTKRISVFSTASVPPVVKRGDVVVGRIEEVRDQAAEVRVGVIRGREERELPGPGMGRIHVSHVRAGYVSDLIKEFRAGDVVRAKVLNVSRELAELSTEGSDLGVIVATCSRCREPLRKEGPRRLRCPSCDHVEFRKLATDYRQGVL